MTKKKMAKPKQIFYVFLTEKTKNENLLECLLLICV